MNHYTTKPIKEINLFDFNDVMRNKEVCISPHATDHLTLYERKLFIEEELIYI